MLAPKYDTGHRSLSDLPIRVLLDTNVIQVLSSFGEYVYEHSMGPELESIYSRLPEEIRSDIESLRCILTPVTRSPVEPVVSNLSLAELDRIGDPVKRSRLLRWGFELYEYAERMENVLELWDPELVEVRKSLQGLDAPLVTEVVRLRCDAMITMDYRTILRRRVGDRVGPVRVLSPTEYWEMLRPWAGLWS